MLGRAAAQSYPDKPIKLVVPYPPGGPIDTTARIVAQQITAHGKTVRLETTGRPYRETGRELPGIDEGARQSTPTNNPPNETPRP